jgi:ureidoglycolate lyase
VKTIKVRQLSAEAFQAYGSFFDVVHPTGHNLGTFYHDHLMFPVVGGQAVGFSCLVSKKTEKMVVAGAEYHNYSGEAILPLDGDIVVHVAPPSKEPVPELTEAFLVPKGTMVKLNVGVWHKGPFSVENAETHILIALAERTYMTDCVVADYAETDQIEVVL